MGLDDPAAAGLVEHREDVRGRRRGPWPGSATCRRLGGRARPGPRSSSSRTDAARIYDADLRRPAGARLGLRDDARSAGSQWQHEVTGIDDVAGPAGRRGSATVNHCMHGKDAIIEEVLDWEPFDHVTLSLAVPDPERPEAREQLRARGARRRPDRRRDARPAAALGEGSGDRSRASLPMLDALLVGQGLATLEAARRGGCRGRSRGGERPRRSPTLPGSRGRNVREPRSSARRPMMSIRPIAVRRLVRDAPSGAHPPEEACRCATCS